MKKIFYSNKKLFVILFGLILLFGVGKVVSASIRSDVDQGNVTTATDAMLILRNSIGSSMAGTDWQASPMTGDVNCDGNKDSADSDLVLRHSLGLDMSSTDWCENAGNAQDIFIIGDSTVRAHTVSWSNRTCDDNPTNTLRGWGDDVSDYLVNPSGEINRARQGASAEEFRDGPPGGLFDELYREVAGNPLPLSRHWDATSTQMATSNGGFLLIQFGSTNESRFYYGVWNSTTGQLEGGRYSDRPNAERISLTRTDFKNAVGFYIDQAQSMNIVPVLMTTPVGRTKNADGTHRDDRGVFPGYVREVAAERNVQLLDLHAKVLHEYGKYTEEVLAVEFGNCINNPNGQMDRIHLEPQGSRKVAGWVKELACELPDQTLCEQFSTVTDLIIPTISLNGDYWMTLQAGEAFVDAGATAVDDVDGNISANIVTAGTVDTNIAGIHEITYNVTDSSGNAAIQVTRYVEVVPTVFMYEDAEDGDIADWIRYAGSGTAFNIIDHERGSRVIELRGSDGINGGFSYGANWQETERHVISWSMKYDEDFTFFVFAATSLGDRFFYYQPTDTGNSITHGGTRYRFSLGSNAMDNSWRTFTRDLQADFDLLDPANEILSIHYISIRGSGKLDDINVKLATNSVGDAVPPTITLNGADSIIVPLNSVYTDAGATANDNIDGDITAQISVDNPVDTAVAASYQVTYRVHDINGNGAFATRVVEVVDATTIHEDAEDGNTTGWVRYWVTAGSAVNNVAGNGGQVIQFTGNDGLNNGYKFAVTPEITSEFVTSWSMNYAEPFKFTVKVRTTNHDPLYLYYTPDDLDLGYELIGSNPYLHNALGSSANDGTWHTFTRDLEADLKRVLPDESLEAIIRFSMHGNGQIDDIVTTSRGDYATFAYDGHTYEIVKTALSWQAASDAAHDQGGYLANIGSIAENHAIYARLNHFISEAEYASTTSANGGGAAYVWIGMNDMVANNTWRWEDNNAHFWTGLTNGSVAGGLFNSWGRNTNEVQREPDNSANNQDAGAIALTEWPLNSGSLGQISQWNDLIETGALFYVIEYDH